MSSRTSYIRPAVWVFSLLAIPLLYLLSIPPLLVFTCDYGPDKLTVWSGGGAHDTEVWVYKKLPPRWFQIYARPGRWLAQHPPFKSPLQSYEKWVEGLAK